MIRICTLLILFTLAAGLSAQPDRNQRFAAAAYLGGNFSQIHGDAFFGYNKPGLRFGIETQYLLRPEYFLTVGVGFAQEGARPDRREIDAEGGNAVELRLSTVEVPFLFNYRIGDKKATGRRYNYGLYREAVLQAGVKLTRLTGFRTSNRGFFDQRITNPAYTEADIDFQDFDLSIVGGISLPVGLKYALFIQHSLSLRGLYRREDVKALRGGPVDVNQLRPYSLTVGGKMVFY